ncbi:uncharacterized protein LOC126757028 isoform X1 [Bactrocera neohumeralis]|uniref:uncharacterized protein LOC126757028 isoform X1 n=1 Tax=Bactrocera neohumeralis TaxID=98809 RepID=UPI002165A393|nr:uncharacterized protein LOC126757028 isoform X1 [Bactrocera neohumeralis]
MSDSDNTHNTADSRLCNAEKDSAACVSRGGKTAQYYREYRARKKAEREKEKLEMMAGSQSRKRKTAAEYQRARVPSISAGASITTDVSTVVNSPITAGSSTRVDGLMTAGPPINVDNINDSDNTHNTADSRLCDAEKDSAARISRGGKTAQYYREYRARKKAEREKYRARKKKKCKVTFTDSTSAVPSTPAGASITTDVSTVVNSPITAGPSTRVDGLMTAGPPINVDKINDSDTTHNTADSRLCDAEKDSAARISRGGKTAQYYREYRARKKAEREKYRARKKKKCKVTFTDSTSAVPSTPAGASITTDVSTVVNSPITAGPSTRVDGLMTAGPPINVDPSMIAEPSTCIDPSTIAGPSTSSGIHFTDIPRRKSTAEYQREYRNESTTEDTEQNNNNTGIENVRNNHQIPYSHFQQHKKAHTFVMEKFTCNSFVFVCSTCDRLWSNRTS